MARPKGSKNKTKTPGARGKTNFVPAKFFNDERYELGKYIIDKFMDIREVNVYRDYTSAFKLIRKFPSQYFWEQMPCKFRIKNLSNLLFGVALERLTMLWRVYQKGIEMDKKIKVDKSNNTEYRLEIVADKNEKIAIKPKTIFEFCK